MNFLNRLCGGSEQVVNSLCGGGGAIAGSGGGPIGAGAGSRGGPNGSGVGGGSIGDDVDLKCDAICIFFDEDTDFFDFDGFLF